MTTCPNCHYAWTPVKNKPKTTGRGSQNNHAWGHSTQIADVIGEDARDVLYEACIASAPHYPTRMNAFGKIVAKTWSQATTQEAFYVIEKLHQIAAEWPNGGIHLVEKKWGEA